jgi:23S rRNA pseudouridine1911/1915/1917 synthase
MKLQAGPEDRGLRVDVFLAGRLVRVTRSHVQTLNKSGAIRINGLQEKDGYRIRGTETIEVDLDHPQTTALAGIGGLEARSMALVVRYEDEQLAVIEKPAGLVVHPGAATGSNTMVHGLLFHFKNLSKTGGPARPGIVHRLDKWTSGLLIVAKDDWTHACLSRAFQERKIHKTYVALVHGKMPRPSAEIALSIGRHSKHRTRMATHPDGRTALSSYRVLEELKGFSLLEVRIMTGRTHQIRVHLSAIGHPVVGDSVYGESRFNEFVKKYGPPGRYFLHAAKLQFNHPKTGVDLKLESPLPLELGSLLERIRN